MIDANIILQIDSNINGLASKWSHTLNAEPFLCLNFNIMKLKDKKGWNVYVKTNTDPYGKCCVDVARRVMELLEEDLTPLHEGYHPDINTPHGLICKADTDIDGGGITGFMAGCVAQMVAKCHERGDEFRRVWNKENQINDEGDKANESGGVLNPALVTVSKK